MIFEGAGKSQAPSGFFADCCGATYTKTISDKTNVYATHKGIRVFDQEFGTPYQGNKQSLHHVKTRNGTITVSIRHTW
jgi:hypothetical protein